MSYITAIIAWLSRNRRRARRGPPRPCSSIETLRAPTAASAAAARAVDAGTVARPVAVLGRITVHRVVAIHRLEVVDRGVPSVYAAAVAVAAAVGVGEAAGADMRGLSLVLLIVVAFGGGAVRAGQHQGIDHRSGGSDGRDL